MVKKSINIKNTNTIMMILDTNICTCLFPKGHKILDDIEPGSSIQYFMSMTCTNISAS